MKAALRAYILQPPVAAFKPLVMPLLPKDVRGDVASERELCGGRWWMRLG